LTSYCLLKCRYFPLANIAGPAHPAVKTRLHRARLALREAIGRYFAS
jgi:DNA-directed RNA polymerase specialized sigma24 family protein